MTQRRPLVLVAGVKNELPRSDLLEDDVVVLVADIAFGDATPAEVCTVIDGARLQEIEVDVLEAFNGVGASLLLGTVADPDAFYEAGDTDLAEVESFSKRFSDAGPITIRHTITPGVGATTGRALIRVRLTTA